MQAEYDKNLKAYHSSPAFLAYLSAKNKAKASNDNDAHDTPSRPTKASQQDRRIDIQPAEDEEDQDDGYSVKHVAYARFVRNHRLINEIFSDMAVPDVRTVVTTNRMIVLRKQVQSLTMHQMKLEAELLQMEEKFESKKRKLIESSDIFQEELKKHCKPAVDEETFHKMVDRQYDVMRRERARLIDEPNNAKNVGVVRPEDADMHTDTEPTPNTATEAQISEQEVRDGLNSKWRSHVPTFFSENHFSDSRILSHFNFNNTVLMLFHSFNLSSLDGCLASIDTGKH